MGRYLVNGMASKLTLYRSTSCWLERLEGPSSEAYFQRQTAAHLHTRLICPSRRPTLNPSSSCEKTPFQTNSAEITTRQASQLCKKTRHCSLIKQSNYSTEMRYIEKPIQCVVRVVRYRWTNETLQSESETSADGIPTQFLFFFFLRSTSAADVSDCWLVALTALMTLSDDIWRRNDFDPDDDIGVKALTANTDSHRVISSCFCGVNFNLYEVCQQLQ